MSVTVKMFPYIDSFSRMAMWEQYQQAFKEINENSVQRHMLTDEEFSDMTMNEKIMKFVARDGIGNFRGLSVMTNHLDEWPLISTAYFAKHFPKDFKYERIWYVGLIFSTNHYGGTRELATYKSLVEAMYPYIAESRGFSVEDYSLHNAVKRRMPQVAAAVLRRINPEHVLGRLDAQSYWAHFFTYPEEGTDGDARSQ